MKQIVVSLALMFTAGLLAVSTEPASAAGSTFSNSSPLTPANGAVDISAVVVSGQPALTDVNVTLNGITHANPEDLDILLESPTGNRVMVLSDAGGGVDVSNLTVSMDDAAASGAPGAAGLTAGTFRPTNFGNVDDGLVPPENKPGPGKLSDLNGTDPNGTWKLYVADDNSNGQAGWLGGGWTLNLSPAAAPATNATCAGLVATTVGTDSAETLVGTPGNDVIAALGGNDVVEGAGGNDVICGGAGDDTLMGGAGNDTLRGEAGKDRLKGGAGKKDVCKGGPAKDAATKCERVRSL